MREESELAPGPALQGRRRRRERKGSEGSSARVLGLLAVVGLSILPLLASSYAAAIAVLGPNIHGSLAGVPEDGRIAYTLSLHNGGDLPAMDVRMEAPLPSGLTLASTGEATWRAAVPDLAANGDLRTDFVVRIEGPAPNGTVEVVATVAYRSPVDSSDHVLTLRSEVAVAPPGGMSPLVLLAASVVAVILAVGYAWKVRSETVRIDQLFLLHDSGMLIRHYTNGTGPKRDSDILGGMLIVLQEFVRDSFRASRSRLEEVRFGDRRVLMARGRHAVIAALVTGKRLNGLPDRLQRAVAGFEKEHGPELADWDGDLSDFGGEDEAFRDLLVPPYASVARP